ncbi:MAG: SufD family Fe-S cluster assembly protein [bacterium]|nr:SufD family Fe-S cluster assembly protein [Mycoplasmatota bacterium]MDD6757013.1 SufD family Fe-S cluster assembly protein [bacterium]MDY2908235.1 SufD family Fe-S cluster assembly protein [Candidatus Faecimonas sp.]
MEAEDKELLQEIVGENPENADSYNIRKNGKKIERKVNPNINIISKEDNSGIDIYVKEDTLFGTVNIPVIITESGLKDVVYNDFHIGKNANIIIVAGCGITNNGHWDAQHDGIHRFYLEEGAKVKYIERHCGLGVGDGKKVLNPVTEIHMAKGSYMVMDTTQIKGVDDTIRTTKAELDSDATLVITEKILTSKNQQAKTEFVVNLKGENSSTHVTSRSVATDNSYQEFISNITGNTKCYAHVECDAIIKGEGQVKAVPEIFAKNVDANLIHEAAIGKIAGEQLMKLMSLGLSEKEAEEVIVNGFLK